MTGAAPCASKGEIGALFSDFLGRNAPEMGSLHEQVCKKRKTSGNESTDSEGADGADVSKKARRRKQNRVAAQTSREKKKKYLTNLENQVNCLNQQNMDLQAQLLALQEENRRLKEGSSPSDMPSLITSIVKAEPQSESYSMPALKVKAETEYSMPTLTTLQNDPEYPMAMVARDIAHLASSMQTTPITFESAVGGDDGFCFDAEPCVSDVASTPCLPEESVPFLLSGGDTFDDFSCDHREFDLPLGSFPMPVLC